MANETTPNDSDDGEDVPPCENEVVCPFQELENDGCQPSASQGVALDVSSNCDKVNPNFSDVSDVECIESVSQSDAAVQTVDVLVYTVEEMTDLLQAAYGGGSRSQIVTNGAINVGGRLTPPPNTVPPCVNITDVTPTKNPDTGTTDTGSSTHGLPTQAASDECEDWESNDSVLAKVRIFN